MWFFWYIYDYEREENTGLRRQADGPASYWKLLWRDEAVRGSSRRV